MARTRSQYRAQVIATTTMTRAQTRSLKTTGHPITKAPRKVRRRALPPSPPPVHPPSPLLAPLGAPAAPVVVAVADVVDVVAVIAVAAVAAVAATPSPLASAAPPLASAALAPTLAPAGPLPPGPVPATSGPGAVVPVGPAAAVLALAPSADQLFWYSRRLSILQSTGRLTNQAPLSPPFSSASPSASSSASSPVSSPGPGPASAALGAPVESESEELDLSAVSPPAAYQSPHANLPPSLSSSPAAARQPHLIAAPFSFGIGLPLPPTHSHPIPYPISLFGYRYIGKMKKIIQPAHQPGYQPPRWTVDFRRDLVKAIAKQHGKRDKHLSEQASRRRMEVQSQTHRPEFHRFREIRRGGKGWDEVVRKKRRCLKVVERREMIERGEKVDLGRVWEGSKLRAVENADEMQE